MNRTIGLLVTGALLLLGGAGYFRPDLFPGIDVPQIAWLLMALLLLSGASWGFWRFRYDGGRALSGILFWAVALTAVALGYELLN